MNDWYIATLNEKKGGGPGGAQAHADAKVEMLGAITATIAGQVGVGNIGAMAVEDDRTDGYYLVKWTGTPGVSAGGHPTCTGHWLARIHELLCMRWRNKF